MNCTPIIAPKTLFKILVLGLLLAAAGLSCAAYQKRRMNPDNLRAAAESFNDAIRWRDYERAVQWIAPPQQNDFWRYAEALRENVRICEFEIQDLIWNDPHPTGFVVLRFRVYHLNNPSIETRTLEQAWLFAEAEGDWRVTQPDLQSLLEAKF